MVDVNRVLKDSVKKGTVKIGERETKKAIVAGDAKLVVIANNCTYKEDIEALASENKIPIYHYKSNSVDLGNTCGKSYNISSFAIIDEGASNVMSLA